MSSLCFHSALLYLVDYGLLKEVWGGYVDDETRSEGESFEKLSRKTGERFELVNDQFIPFSFTGFALQYNTNGQIVKDQHEYLHKLEHLTNAADFLNFRSTRMRLAWLASTRSDCLFEVSKLAQVTEEIFEISKRQCVRKLNQAVDFALENRVRLFFLDSVSRSCELLVVLVHLSLATQTFRTTPFMSPQRSQWSNGTNFLSFTSSNE